MLFNISICLSKYQNIVDILCADTEIGRVVHNYEDQEVIKKNLDCLAS